MIVNRLKALAAALATVENRAAISGKNRQDACGRSSWRPVVSTGSLGLDLLLDGGYPGGGLIEIYGPACCGKTTLVLHAIAEAQTNGGMAGYVDAEHALNLEYAAKLGVRFEDLLYSRPENGEQALGILEALVDSDCVGLLVLDSANALLAPRVETTNRLSFKPGYLQGRLANQALRRLTMILKHRKVVVLFINTILNTAGTKLGSRESIVGGDAIACYASMRLAIHTTGALMKGNEVIGSRTRVKVVKNKSESHFGSVEFDIVYGQGICRASEVLDVALASGVCVHEQGWFVYGDNRLAQCREGVRDILQKTPALLARIEAKIVEIVCGKTGVARS